MGRFDGYNERMVDRLHEKWLNPPDEEPIQECDFCNREAEYDVCGTFYCAECMESEFRIRR